MTVSLQRNADGSATLSLTPDMVAHLTSGAASEVAVFIEDRGLVIQPASMRRRRRYKLSALLADYDQIPKDPEEEFEWLNSPPVGREIL